MKSLYKANIFLALSGVGFLIYSYFGVEYSAQIKDIIPDPQKYYISLVSGIPILMGLVVVLSVFYLGKFHDYKRDYIKESSRFKEQQIVMKIILKKIKNKKFNEDEIEIFKKDYDENIVDTNSLAKKLVEDSTENLKDLAAIEKHFQEFPKAVSIMLGLIIITLSFIMIFSIINDQSDSTILWILIGSIGLGICLFVIIWWAYEETMYLHDEALRLIMYDTSLLKTSINNLRETLNKFQRTPNSF